MNIVDRAKNILIQPSAEWEVIKAEKLTVAEMFTQYAIILAAIPAIAGFIGNSIIGHAAFSLYGRTPVFAGLIQAVFMFMLSLGGVYLMAYIIDMLAPSFGAGKNMEDSMKVAVFSWTASWIAGIFAILPPISWLSIVGLYSLYLLYLGMRIIKEPPADKLVGYFVVSLVVAIIIYVIIGLIVGAIMAIVYAIMR
nr:YIP1 family protein [candidate division Zixibacteria bacterium]